MKYDWMDEYLMSKKGVEKDLQESWNWIRYKINNKMFAAICLDEKNQPYYITLKLEPLRGEVLRKQYEDIIPGYYMNKKHWNSVVVNGKVLDDLLKEMLDESYNLILRSLSKKKQLEILEGERA
ncbi:MmcQ/YjbR family DNA-binding protein [Defluviitalea raffinosedens]|jgi:predicted DNA-binding protein (MmcQ/YjbR family)|uniref:MmcQ/YjbR family DNA-binding protein n=1 Tax=Defluviitalea raffinosedens TaxID=1450156 RepID=A0A7C8HDE4_9FIRM|nr:MmcQ/YjbR family DNA-binding protein [Defluviitalea raffinosedens]KAE9630664.1 MmcQ/YjbR family DNA-binding protein [Defluviitalea raffinosedens]MBM7686332.1 putative DNA-binding protein (MmcQ/YjbR family) [Defluviitalea raffinosedens]MBZ4667151.1 MmcQ/YjbR family DNA-binding protein [Defluviitaleaceae bacterium]HHW67817.1 MmcQ/YjbR family DNA-binding protein [Candidatus Epulonipiscium sp.]